MPLIRRVVLPSREYSSPNRALFRSGQQGQPTKHSNLQFAASRVRISSSNNNLFPNPKHRPKESGKLSAAKMPLGDVPFLSADSWRIQSVDSKSQRYRSRLKATMKFMRMSSQLRIRTQSSRNSRNRRELKSLSIPTSKKRNL
jgi:hypothetical protein